MCVPYTSHKYFHTDFFTGELRLELGIWIKRLCSRNMVSIKFLMPPCCPSSIPKKKKKKKCSSHSSSLPTENSDSTDIWDTKLYKQLEILYMQITVMNDSVLLVHIKHRRLLLPLQKTKRYWIPNLGEQTQIRDEETSALHQQGAGLSLPEIFRSLKGHRFPSCVLNYLPSICLSLDIISLYGGTSPSSES